MPILNPLVLLKAAITADVLNMCLTLVWGKTFPYL